MINHLVLFKVKPDVNEEKIEWMMRETRIQLLRFPKFLAFVVASAWIPKPSGRSFSPSNSTRWRSCRSAWKIRTM